MGPAPSERAFPTVKWEGSGISSIQLTTRTEPSLGDYSVFNIWEMDEQRAAKAPDLLQVFNCNLFQLSSTGCCLNNAITVTKLTAEVTLQHWRGHFQEEGCISFRAYSNNSLKKSGEILLHKNKLSRSSNSLNKHIQEQKGKFKLKKKSFEANLTFMLSRLYWTSMKIMCSPSLPLHVSRGQTL